MHLLDWSLFTELSEGVLCHILQPNYLTHYNLQYQYFLARATATFASQKQNNCMWWRSQRRSWLRWWGTEQRSRCISSGRKWRGWRRRPARWPACCAWTYRTSTTAAKWNWPRRARRRTREPRRVVVVDALSAYHLRIVSPLFYYELRLSPTSHFTLKITTCSEINRAFIRDGEGAHYLDLVGAGWCYKYYRRDNNYNS